MCITYSCHSAAKRAQFSMSEADTFESEGKEAKRKIMQSASSISRTASMNVGYLDGMSARIRIVNDMMLTAP